MQPYYDHGGIQIFLGDCREILPSLGRFDLLLTDPPYGIGKIWQGGSSNGWRSSEERAERNAWDGQAPDAEWLGTLRDVAAAQVFWGGNHFVLPPARGWLVWRKEINPALSLGDAELAWSNRDAPVRVFDHPRNKLTGRKMPEHPTAKPVALMSWCLGFFPEARTVIDPYMGSGPVAKACKGRGLRYVGIELVEKYCEIAAKRLAQETLFGAVP